MSDDKPCPHTSTHGDAVWCSMYWLQGQLCPHCPMEDLRHAELALADYNKNGGLSLEQLKRELSMDN